MVDIPGNTPIPIGTTLLATPPSAIFPGQIGIAIASPSPIFTQVRLNWSIVDTIWGGTQAMRLAGKRFLPQEPEELENDYIRRLSRTTLHNFYKRSIQSGVSKVFAKDPYLEDANPVITSFCADVDTQGRNLGQFAKGLLEDGVNHGVSYLLVDYARVPQDYSNLAEEQTAGNRPYWVHVQAANVLDARSAKFATSERLSYFKFEEQVTELSDDLTHTTIFNQIRIFKQDPAKPAVLDQNTGAELVPAQGETPVYFAVYRQQNTGGLAFNTGVSNAGNWVLKNWGQLSVDSIPACPIYTNKIGFFLGNPPLMDLAELNIEHWQARSDYNNILHIVQVPILLGTGFGAELDEKGGKKKLKIAVNAGTFTASATAKLKWIEHGGASIAAARINIQDLEDRMSALGLILTAQTSGDVTATAHAISSSESNSLLKSYALNLQDTLNSALDFTAEYLGIPNTARVVVNVDYAVDYTSNTTMADVLTAFNAGVIDQLTVIAEAKRRNVLDPAAVIVPPPVNESSTPAKPAPIASTPSTPDVSNDSSVNAGTTNQ